MVETVVVALGFVVLPPPLLPSSAPLFHLPLSSMGSLGVKT